ncbi:hypothetical protein C0Q16_29400, partial [Klebsiella pneumoniae]
GAAAALRFSAIEAKSGEKSTITDKRHSGGEISPGCCWSNRSLLEQPPRCAFPPLRPNLAKSQPSPTNAIQAVKYR